MKAIFSRYQRKVHRARQLSLPDWGDVLLACYDLAIARIVLIIVKPSSLITHHGFSTVRKGRVYAPDAIVKRVSRVRKSVSLAARYVPWRSDCLIQAIAARRRLHISGLKSELRLGVRKTQGKFAAHAWLMQGETIVTGGDVGEYSRLV